MAEITPIVWTVEDVELGLLEVVVLRPGMLRFKRSYRLVDGDGKVITVLPERVVKADVAVEQIPAQVLSALQQIDAWTRERALQHAGLVQVEQPEEPI